MTALFRLSDLIHITVDWPMPPSVNKIWRRGRVNGVYLDVRYKVWRERVHKLAWVAGKHPKISGAFTADIKLDRAKARKGSDIDNRAKAVLDAAEAVGYVADDRSCRRLTVEWTDAANAPAGCRLILREIVR